MADKTTTDDSQTTAEREIPHVEETQQPQQQENEQNQEQQQSSAENLTSKMEKMNISSSSFSIWPPTQRTREAVVNRLVETLSTPSVLSKRYGSMLPKEASETAKSIEEEAYNVAANFANNNNNNNNDVSGGGGGSSSSSSIDEGIEILQVYSKEISKRMLHSVKSKGSNAANESDVAAANESDRATVASEDVSSSIDNESAN